ncbi:MAG: mechanosensitive ion channel [Isosphaeraceae bacterium]
MKAYPNTWTGLARAAVWPAYAVLAAYAARQAPWPRSFAVPVGTALGFLALAGLATNLLRWAFGRRGWAESALGVPPDVTRQAKRVGLAVVLAHVLFLLPSYLLSNGLVAPQGRPVQAPVIAHTLILLFEVCVLGVVFRVTRPRSPVFLWMTQFPERLGWLTRRRRLFASLSLAAVTTVIVLDSRGYSLSARRFATGMAGSVVVAVLCWVMHKFLLRTIDRRAWHWIKLGKALAGSEPPGTTDLPQDLATRLRRLAMYLTCGAGLFLASWFWDVDLALFQFIGTQNLWGVDGKEEFVTVGDLTRGLAIVGVALLAWRHISTFFAVAVFPHMPDDPGMRYAVVTLCRYAVLGVGLLCGLSSIHLGVEKIGVVLAALGVGLGFGLQEIVSNFVCGIILLLERPIRVGDIVTVSGTTGKVDRINIRATTITNFDNQSMIVPNRGFITGEVVNWTLKDKIIRLTMRVKVVHGTDPDRVSELLLSIIREDSDVLHTPAPSALLEEFGVFDLTFVMHAHVPDPSLGGKVKHRLSGQIQRRFMAEGIQIALPTQKLLVKPFDGETVSVFGPAGESLRVDERSPTPPLNHWPAQVREGEHIDPSRMMLEP